MSATISATGTWTVPQVAGQPTGGSGVLFKSAGGAAFDARISLQKGINLFDEVNQFVTLMSGAMGVPGYVALDQIRLIINDMRRTPSMGEKVYAP